MVKILVGLSGGVDSAVSAILLKEQGFEVIGATMAIWGNREIKGIAAKTGKKNACFGPNEKEDIESARKIAQKLNIPYYVFDCADEYEKIVLKHFRNEYLNGATPNPCVFCNALVKFGVLPYLAKNAGVEFDKFATGHYARIIEKNGKYHLYRALNHKKDQSYFLYRLVQDKLKNTIFPLGSLTKEEVRKIAAKYDLEIASKPDSQDFFEGDYNELLNIAEKKGNIVNLDGNILGEHKGFWNYTIGQRKGLGISSKEALYVLKLDSKKNEVVVGEIDKTFKKILFAKDINLISVDKIEKNYKCKAKIRSSQEPQDAIATQFKDGMKVEFIEYQKSIAKGQSIVLYDNDCVIGGGVIESVLE